MLHNRVHHILLCIIILSIAGVSYAQNTTDSRTTKTKKKSTQNDSPILIEQNYKVNAEKLDLFGSTNVGKKTTQHIISSQTGQAPPDFKVKVDGDVGPNSDNTYNLGSNSARWKDVYVGPHSLHIGNGPNRQAVLSHSYDTSTLIQRLLFDVDDDGTDDFFMETGGALSFFGPLKPNENAGDSAFILQSKGSSDAPQWINVQDIAWSKTGNSDIDTTTHFLGTTDNNDIVFRTDNIIRARLRNSTGDADEGAFEPYMDNTYSLGTPTHRWSDLYLGPSSIKIGGFINGAKGTQNQQTIDEATISYSDGVLIINKNIGSTGMVPNNTDVFTLGTTDNRWSDLYLGGNSLHIGNQNTEAVISFDTANSILRISSDGDGLPEFTIAANGDVSIASLGAGGIVMADPTTGLLTTGGSLAGFESSLTFTNGLTRTANTIKLGGALSGATDIPLGGNNLTFSGTGKFGVGTSGTPASMFSVGSTSQFQINSTGAIAAATGISSSGTIAFSGLNAGGITKASAGTGSLSIATAGSDYEVPLTFNNGLTRTSNTVKLGGLLIGTTDVGLNSNNLTFSGTGKVGIGTSGTPASMFSVGSTSQFQVNSTGAIAAATGITSSGTITLTGLNAGGMLKTSAGTGNVSIATAGVDYEVPLTFDNGLTRTANNVALGGALAATTTITTASGKNLVINGGGKVGIETASPNTVLDVNGDVAVRFAGITLSNGSNTAVSVGSASAIRITGPSAAFTIHGIASGYDGKLIDLYNASGQTMTLASESSSESTTGNRITIGTQDNLEIKNKSMVRLTYNSTDSRWIVTSSTTKSPSMLWTMKTYSSFGTTNQNAWSPDFAFTCHRVSSSGNINMTGINSGSAQDGTVIVIINTGTSTITLQNESSNATSAAYRILTGTGNNEALSANKPATLVYDATSHRWRVISPRYFPRQLCDIQAAPIWSRFFLIQLLHYTCVIFVLTTNKLK